jgi:hypothetical protein
MLNIVSWKALLGILTNVAVSGDVALTRSNVEEKTAHDPIAPHHIMVQKKGTSRNGMLWKMLPSSPERMTIGVRIAMERRDV